MIQPRTNGGRRGRAARVMLLWALPVLGMPSVGEAQGTGAQQPGPTAETRLLDVLPSVMSGEAASDFNKAVVSQLATFPLGSSAGGFTFTFNPTTQTFTRSSDSFGPLFAERAMTSGAGTFNVGLTYQRATYDHVEGRSLKDGSIRFVLQDQPLSGDVVAGDLVLDLTTDTAVAFITYGLTHNLDVGAAVPFVRVDLGATVSRSVIQRMGAPLPGGPQALPARSVDGRVTGLGDIVLRAKYNFLEREGGGASLVADVTMPTGDSDNLLGTGATRAKLLFVTSTRLGRLAPHVNAGYSIVGTSTNPSIITGNEYHFVAGAETVLSSRLTVALDFVSRTITDVGRLRLGPALVQAVNDPGVDQLNREPGNLGLKEGAVGLKWHAGGTWLVSTALLVPLGDAGLTDQLTWSVGLDWTR